MPCLAHPMLPDFTTYPKYDLNEQSDELGASSSSDRLVYGKLLVHPSHTMASSSQLGLYFCTQCGAWGSKRTKYLGDVCNRKPKSQPMAKALSDILKGKHPDRRPPSMRGGL